MTKRKEWNDMSGGEKMIGSIIMIVILVVLLCIIVFSVKRNDADRSDTSSKSFKSQAVTTLADKVMAELSKLNDDTKVSLASTGSSGHQGDIKSVDNRGRGEVRVNVSTYTDNPSEGKIIARNIFNMICIDVPELNSLYVRSGNGLDSKSIYRSESGICK